MHIRKSADYFRYVHAHRITFIDCPCPYKGSTQKCVCSKYKNMLNDWKSRRARAVRLSEIYTWLNFNVNFLKSMNFDAWFFATNSLCFISIRSRFWWVSTHPPSAVLEKYGWISHGKVIVNTFRVHRTTRNSIRFTVAGLNIVSPKHWMNNVWTLRKIQWLKIHQKISNHFNAQRFQLVGYRCKRVKFIQSLRTERTAHISFHLFSHIQFFSSLIPFQWTAYAAINAMWPWHFDHFHPDSICYTGDGNYNHSIDVVHNFSATIHQYIFAIATDANGFLHFDQRSLLFSSRIYF